MGRKVLDPRTATVEEVVAAGRQVRRDKKAAVLVGAVVAAVVWFFAISSPAIPDGWRIPILIIAFAIGYIATEEILKRR